jgi:glutamate dehydrogenase (NAD(P)+)
MIRVINYLDPVERCPGFLVYDGTDCRLAAGGCRMRADVTAEQLSTLAARMSLKQRVLGINVDGAKCGIAYNPAGPHRRAVLLRFLDFLRDELRTRFSMGCDMGTRFEELDRMAAELGVGSAKYAVQVAQRLSEHEFRTRMRLLDSPVGVLSLGQRRAGHALAHAALAAAAHTGRKPARLTCAIQGFGNLGRAAAASLHEQGVTITAIADEYGCVIDPRGLDIARMITLDQRRPVAALAGNVLRLPPTAIADLPADVLILAGGEDALSSTQAAVLPVPVVVVGANCGLSATADQLLTDRGATVIPDFIGGIGGSASMEALFGPRRTPEPREVLDSTAGLIRELLGDLLDGARERGLTPRQAAHEMAAAACIRPDEPPYGASPYHPARRAPSGRRAAAAATTAARA